MKLAPTLSLPAEIAGRRTAVFGISGSGKSNTATVIIEGLAEAGEQFVLIDHKGEGWGLLSLANGKPSNLDVIIFGEPGGHIKTLTEHHGPQIADFVVESGRSVVLSLTGFDSDQSERRFVASFLRKLYRNKTQRATRTRTLVVFEEAHLFVPESSGQGFKGDVADLAGACQRIVRQGRSFGLGSLVVDQRPQDVAKRVLTQCDTIICHQLVHNKDRDALAAWIDANADSDKGKDFLSSLSSLQEGEAWVWSPKLDIFKRVTMRRRRTFDSGAAPDGSESVKVARKEIDIAALGKHLNDLVEKSKADDPAALRKKIADLERQVYKSAKDVQTDPRALERSHAAGKAEGVREAAGAIAERDRIIRDLSGRMGKGASKASELAALLHVNGEATPKSVGPTPQTTTGETRGRVSINPPSRMPKAGVLTDVSTHLAKSPVAAPAHNPGSCASAAGTGITSRQQRFLDAAATLTTLGAEVTRETVAGWIGVHPRGGSVGEELKALEGAGFITIDRGRIRVTEAGQAAAGYVDPAEAIERAKAGLSARQAKFFEVIVAAYPGETTREEIAAQFDLHPRGGSLGEDLGRLVGRGLVEVSRGRYRAREFLFAGK